MQNRTAEAVMTSTVSPWRQSCYVIIIKFPGELRVIWDAGWATRMFNGNRI